MKLSACIIVKNEEENLPRCLENINGLIEEIVVVDTGSLDKTKKIALDYGCKVVDFQWCNDFAAARNFSIDNATGEWILFLDADEKMLKEDLMRLIKLINSEKKAEAYFLRMINLIRGLEVGETVVLRVFKNKPEYRFVGKVHEQIISSIESEKGTNKIIPTEIRIFHYGYDLNTTDSEAKSKRNLDILLTYPNDKKDGYYYYSLGNEYARINNFEKAIIEFKKGISLIDYTKNRYIYFPYLILNLMKSFFIIKQFSNAIKVLKTYGESLVNCRDMYFLAVISYMEMGKYSNSKLWLSSYLKSNYSNYEYPNNNYDKKYNIKLLEEQINKNIIKKSKNLIGVGVLVENESKDILNLIKNINELSEEVIIFDLNINNQNSNQNLYMDEKRVTITKEENEYGLLKYFKSKWMLIMKEDEFLPYAQQLNLVRSLENTTDMCSFNINIFDIKANKIIVEKRIVNIKKIQDETQNINITIYRNYV